MLAGRFLAGQTSDQFRNGFAYREWAANMFRELGRIPEWNPEHFGGLPFIAAQHGDIFYPSAWLRWILPTDVAMNLSFAIHFVLAGFFLFLLARSLKLSWVSSLTAGLAYQLAGVNISLVHPGHDGKLFVVALAPLALLGLSRAIKHGKIDGYFLLSLAVGLSLISPQYQMAFYLLIAAGMFALYLVFWDKPEDKIDLTKAAKQLSAALGAVLVGWGIGSIGIIPLYNYVPFSPRSESAQSGFEWATSYAFPWVHLPELIIADFSGRVSTAVQSYWGPNGIKFHSEYIGLAAITLAVYGLLWKNRRNLALFCAAGAVFFMLISLGSGTPFYTVWYELIPFVRQTRAPGMALYAVTLFVALLAGLGIDRIQQSEKSPWMPVGIVAGVFALFGLMGIYFAMAEMMASGISRLPPDVLSGQLRFMPLISAVAVGSIALVMYLKTSGKMTSTLVFLAIPLSLSADLWFNGKNYWVYSDAPDTVHGTDPIIDTLKEVPRPFRVHDVNAYSSAPNRSTSVLMGHEITQLLGHHAFELHTFDELMGGQDMWTNLYSYGAEGGVGLANSFMHILDLYSVNYITTPQGVFDTLPGFEKIITGAETAFGRGFGTPPADLFSRVDPIPWARVIPGAVEFQPPVEAYQVVPDPRFPLNSVVTLPPGTGAPSTLNPIPDPSESAASMVDWEPGRMTIQIDPAPSSESFLLVAENWYPDWNAIGTVDGTDDTLEVLPLNHAMLGVRLPAGTNRVTLEFRSGSYRLGRTISLLSVVIVIGGLMAPPIMRRRSAGG